MRILVTGSADGLGRAAADSLQSAGHDVVVHAGNRDRAASLAAFVDRGADIVVGDFTDRDAVRRIAAELNGRNPLGAVIHNAGVWRGRAVMPVNIIGGAHQDGRTRRTGRSGTGTPNPGMARGKRSTPGAHERRVLVPPAKAAATQRSR